MAKIQSDWEEYIGISCTTITDGTTEVIDVVVPEFTPTEKGDPKKGELHTCEVTDPTSGVKTTAKVLKTKTVRCTYLGSGNTNQLIPCVATGERVRVFNYGGTQQYYWAVYGRDPGLRLHERVRWFAMNQPKSVANGTYEDVTDDNTYFVDINTNPGQKEIHIHSSINDGEPFKYDVRIMPEKGIVEIVDNIGHELSLNSFEHRWYMRNVDDSFVELIKEVINISCKDTINIHAGKFMNIDVGKNMTTKVGENISTTSGKTISEKTADMSVNASSSYTQTSPSTTESASAMTISGGTTNITGGGGDCVISSISLVKHKHPVPPHCPGSGMSSPPVP